jgi:hypothetical protein
MKVLSLSPCLCILPVTAAAEVVVSPRVTVVEREGITGGGHPVIVGDRVLNFYPNHTDDFGGSNGTASRVPEVAKIGQRSERQG